MQASAARSPWFFPMALLAVIWNSLEVGDFRQAHASTGLAMAAIDQASRDGRRGSAISHGPEPPAETLARPPPRSLLQPNTPLAAPAWVAAAQGVIREAAQTEEAYRKFGKGGDKKGKKGKDDKKEP